MEYYKQTTEDGRTIGTQMFTIIVSLTVSLGGILYTITSIDIAKLTNNLIYLESNILLYVLIRFLIILLTVAYLSLVFYGIYSSLALFIHLNNMNEITVKIEQLQKDMLFKKMTQVDLFYFDEIVKESENEFKQIIQKIFSPYSIKKVQTKANRDEILIYIDMKKFLFTKKEKRSGTLRIDSQKNTAILKFDGVEIDRFDVKKEKENENEKFKLYESELKHRFREIYPHSSVYRTSPKMQIAVFIMLIALIILLSAGNMFFS